MDSEIEKRKSEILKAAKKYKDWIVYIILGAIIFLGTYIRTRNLGLLKDVTTGKYLPADPDAIGFLRYVEYLLDHGKLMVVDTLRYHPFGYNNISEFSFLSHFIVYLYKIIHFFNPKVTIQYIDVIYPAICFAIAMVFFFLLVRKLFNYKVALVSTAFLSVLPAFLFRTMSGISDKEALAVMLMFIAMYFYVLSWKENNLNKALIFGALSGLFTGFMGLTWGGVNFVFLTIGIFALIEILFNKFDKKDLFAYGLWVVISTTTLVLSYPERFNYMSFIYSTTTSPMILALVAGIIQYLVYEKNILKIKEKIKINLPSGLVSILISLALGLVFMAIFIRPDYIIERLSDLFIDMTEPFGRTRWALTVAESQQPYFKDWVGQMNWNYVIAFMLGSVYLFYEMIKPLKKRVLELTAIYAVFIFAFAMSRYSSSSTFNGTNNLSIIAYVGSLIMFIVLVTYAYVSSYYKDKETFSKIKELEKPFIFTLIWFIIMVVGARSATRLIFIFSPVTAVLVGYFLVILFELILSKVKEKEIRYLLTIGLIILAVFSFMNFEKSTMAQARSIGPSTYSQQWQYGMQWVRENTPEDAVFAHWWDYGYLVQYGGQRATLSDGGNALGAVNHFIGRHVLTATSEKEALEFLKARNATNLLIVSDELGKYPAYSSIGSDRDYDRYAWLVPPYILDENSIQETRDETIYIYKGGLGLDEDFIYNDQVFPAQSAAVGGILIPISNTGNQTQIKQPTVALFYNGVQTDVPLECLYINGQKIVFQEKGMPACFMILPNAKSSSDINPMGAGLFLSRRVSSSLFAHLYLFGEESQYFKLVYSDEDKGYPLLIYQSNYIIGPMKIWEISYPNNLVIPQEYYGTELPDPEVEKVKR